MEIRNPRRVLFLGHSDSGVLSLLKELTGSAPTPRIIPSTLSSAAQHEVKLDDDGSHVNVEDSETPKSTVATTAGLTHSLSLQNAYYSATVPIWLDEPPSPAEWQADFTSDEATDVVCAVGAWVIVFRLNTSADASAGAAWAVKMMDAVRAVLEAAHGSVEAWDGVLLCVGVAGYFAGCTDSTVSGEETNEWEDACWERGFEFVDVSVKSTRVRDGRGEALGVARVFEALEANDWSAEEDAEDTLGLLDSEEDEEFGAWRGVDGEMDGDEDAGFALERAEMEREIMGLKMALSGQQVEDGETDNGVEGEAKQVDELERMMGKMLAVRDMTAHMPQSERKKFAARAVHDVMKTI